MNPNEVRERIERIISYTLIALTLGGFSVGIYFSSIVISDPTRVNFYLIIPFLFFLFPYIILSIYKYHLISSKISNLPRFLRDIVDNVEGGMDFISAIHSGTRVDYNSLNPDITKLSNRLHWGVNMYEALELFARDVGDSAFQRDFQLVIQAQKIGGNVKVILKELATKISVETLRETKRRKDMASVIVTGYLSFSIFIFIIVLLFSSLFSSMVFDEDDELELRNQKLDSYNKNLSLFIILSYELAILSGFLFGLMSSNNLVKGGPHVVFLVLIVFLVFFLSLEFNLVTNAVPTLDFDVPSAG